MIFLYVMLLCDFKSVYQQVYFPQDYSSLYGRERMQATFWQMYNNLYYFKSQNHHVHPPPPVQAPSQSSSSQQNLDIRQSPATHHKFINSIEQRKCEPKMDIDYIGLMAWLLFCLFVLMVGVWAGCTRTRRGPDREHSQEQMMLAGRDINLGVGVLTMAATWVGGGFIIGAAQGVYTRGLLWTHAPVFYSLSLVIGGSLFAKKMRDAKYFTMIDPFTQKYGKWGSVLVVPAAISEIIWCAAILSSLGSTIFIILHVEDTFSIYISAILSLSYTLCGGAISVAYTDVVQILFVIFGLILALPFSVSHPAVGNLFADTLPSDRNNNWYGSIQHHEWGAWIDTCLLCLLGGIPWQSYFQRVLSAQTGTRSVILSFGGSLIALALCVPALMFGVVGLATDWSMTSYNSCQPSLDQSEAKFVLPLCLKYLTPSLVSWIGVGVISAAVMSSADSSLLSSSSLIARNIWSKLIRPGCGEKEILRVLWCFTFINCGLATLLALQYKSVYELYVLCGDLTYVILFPQLLLVLHFPPSNTYGSCVSFMITFILRILCGDKYLGIPQIITFGEMVSNDCSNGKCSGEMPFRTIIMLIGLVSHLIISWLTYFMFCIGGINLKWDILSCFLQDRDTGEVRLGNSRQLDTPVDTLENALASQSKYLKKLDMSDNSMIMTPAPKSRRTSIKM